jgi:hypothetical protein
MMKSLQKKQKTSGWTKEKDLTKKQEIKTGMFCTVETSDYCQYGIKRGNLVYVYGEFMSRLSEDDPYAFRKLFIATKTIERHVTDSEKPFTVDGDNLKPVKKTAQERLEKLLEGDFKPKENSDVE